MKEANDRMIDLLESDEEIFIADLYTFSLNGGDVLRWTGFDEDQTVDDLAYSAQGPILKRGSIRSFIGVQVSTLDVTIYPNGTTIGSRGLAQFAGEGGFDGARLRLERVFMPADDPEDTSAGTLVQFAGAVGEIDIVRGEIQMRVNSHVELLNCPLPRNVYQAGCRHAVYHGRCGLSKPDFEVDTAVLSGSTKRIIECDLAEPAGRFNLGTVEFIDGPNAGIMRTVRSYVPGVLTLMLPLPYTPGIGDAFKAAPGCNNLYATCGGVFSNTPNYGGQRFIPVAETAF